MFRLLGFDVRVQPGFIMLMGLIVVLYQSEFGLWLAGAIAVFTVIHELGHAVAARRTGAHAEISLGFLAGYASYTPNRELSRLEQAWISFAGPCVQIVVSVAVLIAMGVNPVDPSSFGDTPASAAIWWAGPIIGLLNLIPVLPLDGGNIVMYGLDAIIPGRSLHVMIRASIALTVIGAGTLFLSGRGGFIIFIGFLLITQLQMLQSTTPRQQPTSAWQAAAATLERGHDGRARRMLVATLSHPQPTVSAADLAIPAAQADRLIDLLPTPYPSGDPGNEYILANLMLTTGRYDDAAHYAADSFGRVPNTLSAAVVARAAAALGDQGTAIGWLRTAADEGTSPEGLASTIDRAPELESLRVHPDVLAIRRSLSAAR